MKAPKNPPSYFGATYNRLFTDEQNALILFVKFQQPVECAHCQRKSKFHWTCLVPFKCAELKPFIMDSSKSAVLPPLSPVCRNHLLTQADDIMEQMTLALRYYFRLTYDRLVREHKAKEAQ